MEVQMQYFSTLGSIDRTNFKLYAEYLPNLRQINVFATLPSPSWKWTRAFKILPKTLKVYHRIGPADEDDLEVSMSLPYFLKEAHYAEYDVAAIFQLPVSKGTSHLFWRLDADRSSPSTMQQRFLGTNSMENWSERVLKSGARVACAKCFHPLTKGVNAWKNLPSGGWADMMDLWHCHKPDVPRQSTKGAGSTKGYAAAKTLKPSEDCALVDVGSFYFAQGQLLDLEVMILPFVHALPLSTNIGPIMIIFELGIKKVASPRPRSSSWLSHRYNCPR